MPSSKHRAASRQWHLYSLISKLAVSIDGLFPLFQKSHHVVLIVTATALSAESLDPVIIVSFLIQPYASDAKYQIPPL